MTIHFEPPDPASEQYSSLQVVHDIIDSYLQNPEASTADTAKSLTDPIRWAHEPLAYWTDFLFSDCIKKALQIPLLHPLQSRLIELLLEISNQPGPDGEDEIEWYNLPTFMGQWGELLTSQDFEKPSTLDHQLSAVEWKNTHGFLAAWWVTLLRVQENQDVDPVRGEYLGLITLRKTLEIPRGIETLNFNIPAAASWIIVAGKQFKVKCQQNERPYQSTMFSHGDVQFYNGYDSWNEDRWNFWARRFQELAASKDLAEQARQSALDAYQVMS